MTISYGQGITKTANFTGGGEIQQAEFVDRLEFMVQSENELILNVNVKEGVNRKILPDNTMSLNSFMWVVNTSAPFMEVDGQMLVSLNRSLLVALKPAGSSPSTMLTVAKGALNATSGQFLPLDADMLIVRELPEDRILVPESSQLDGQYIILVTEPRTVGNTPDA